MSAPAIAPPLTCPDPAAAPGDDRPSRFGQILNLVRKLIDYGKELATSLQRRDTTNHDAATRSFGTRDIQLILERITRGLLRASALEARVAELAVRPAPTKPSRAPTQRTPRAPQPAAAQPTGLADPRLAHLPTPEQIAAEIRSRPVGAVIADICRDLGIMPSHPLWRELSLIIMRHGGSPARLFKDICDRMLPIPPPRQSIATATAWPSSFPPSPATLGTGPP